MGMPQGARARTCLVVVGLALLVGHLPARSAAVTIDTSDCNVLVTLPVFAPLRISCESSPSCTVFQGNPAQPQVTCNAAGRVTDLTLLGTSYMNVSDDNIVLDAVTGLTALTSLDLGSAKIRGTLPASWSTLRNLSWISVAYNRNLVGTLPASWSAMTQLGNLQLPYAGFTGTLPASWSALTSLSNLDLSSNGFTGTVPDSWSAMSNLWSLKLGHNQLAGTLPASWSSMRGMYTLEMDNNQFTGTLPSSWSTMTNVVQIILTKNNFTAGSIPSSWSSMTRMVYASLNDTGICGAKPAGWPDRIYVPPCSPAPSSSPTPPPPSPSPSPKPAPTPSPPNCRRTLRTGPGYVGCFKDSASERAMPSVALVSPYMTIGLCRALAATQNFRYYAVQNSTDCYISNDDTTPFMYGEDASLCTMACAGNLVQQCGGANANAVYDINTGGQCAI